MPFRTANGTHYHLRSGCSGAFISCGTDGLAPCLLCCGAARLRRRAAGTAKGCAGAHAASPNGDPTDGPAPFEQEFTTPQASGVYAIRISKHRDAREPIAESVESKGREVGALEADDEQEHIEDLEMLLEMTSSTDPLPDQPLPDDESIGADDVRAIYFDMDGTLADLYSVPDWLPRLLARDPTPYEDARPLVDMSELNDVIVRLQRAGWHVGVVSWLAKVSDDQYSRAVSAKKRMWLMRHLPTVDEINIVSYGVAKQTAVAKSKNAVLVDDEPQNLDEWVDDLSNRTAIDASDPNTLIDKLRNLSDSA